MDFLRSFLGDILTIAGYCVLFLGIHKLYQIATTLGEIKEVLQGQRRLDSLTPAAGLSAASSVSSADDAASYAQNLLRAVNAEQQRSEAEPKAV